VSRSKVAARPEAAAPADRVAWWSLLAAVFLVPLAMSNFTWLGVDQSLTSDLFDLPKVVVARALVVVAAAAWAWGIHRRGGRIRA
jgi:hypothetical protein